MHPVIMCALAGFSTGLGALPVVANGGITNSKMSFYQGFAAGVMLTVSVADLIPHSAGYYMGYLRRDTALFCTASLVLCGWIIGAMAGSLCDVTETDIRDDTKRAAYRLSVLTTFIMVLHNLPEGMLTIFTSARDAQLGLRVTAAVALHNIPEGMAIAAPVLYVTGSKIRAVAQSIAAGMAELAGGLLAYLVFKSNINPAFLNGLMPVIAGIMCRTAATELIPAAARLSNIKHTVRGIMAGILVMLAGIFAF